MNKKTATLGSSLHIFRNIDFIFVCAGKLLH